MKKLISITLVLCLVFSMFTVTSSAMTKKASKYVKVKRTTYQTYKKAYTENPKLKKQISSLKSTIKSKDAEIARLNAEINKLNNTPDQTDELKEVQEKLDSANSSNKWVWNNLRSLGITYKGKVWTIPAEYPEQFMIDGVIYKVNITGGTTNDDEQN